MCPSASRAAVISGFGRPYSCTATRRSGREATASTNSFHVFGSGTAICARAPSSRRMDTGLGPRETMNALLNPSESRANVELSGASAAARSRRNARLARAWTFGYTGRAVSGWRSPGNLYDTSVEYSGKPPYHPDRLSGIHAGTSHVERIRTPRPGAPAARLQSPPAQCVDSTGLRRNGARTVFTPRLDMDVFRIPSAQGGRAVVGFENVAEIVIVDGENARIGASAWRASRSSVRLPIRR